MKRSHPFGKFLLVNLLTFICYLLAGLIANLWSVPGVKFPSLLWAPAGIALVAVLLYGFSVLPSIGIGSIVLALLIFTNWLSWKIWLLAVVSGFTSILQAGLAGWFILRYTATNTPFFRVRDALLYIVITITAALIPTTFGTLTILLLGNMYEVGLFSANDVAMNWVGWWFARATGILVFSSIILIWLQKKLTFSWQEIAEFLFLFIALVIAFLLIYKLQYPFTYTLIPFCVWAAVRLQPQFAILIAFIITILAVMLETHLYTLWLETRFYQGAQIATSITNMVFVQAFVLVIFVTTLILSAVLSEQKKAHQELMTINVDLEERVEQRTQNLAEKNKELKITLVNLKQAQAQLIQAEKMSSLGILTAGIAHEINNPLNFVSANVASLRVDLKDMVDVLNKYLAITPGSKEELLAVNKLVEEIDLRFTMDEIDKLIRGIREGVERTAIIIKNLKTFSRQDQNVLERVNLNDYIDGTLNLLYNQYKNRISIIKKYGDIPLVECYPDRLNQVFMNILQNAIQAIPDKGEIVISTEKLNGKIKISIRDNGTGMSEKTKEKIFEPFFTTKDVGHGTGLGLSISYGIIQEHGGEIIVKSELGKGSEFMVLLPIRNDLSPAS